MKSRFVPIATAAAILVAGVLAAPAAHAFTDALPATAGGWEVSTFQARPAETAVQTVPEYRDSRDTEIDQNQPSGPVYMAAFSQGDLAQSFMQINSNIAGAGILLQAGTGSTDNVTIQVWTGLPNAGGTMLAEGSAMGTAGQWVDVFWDYVAVTPGTTYYLVFVGNTTLGIAGDTGNPYPHGHVFANAGFTPFPNFDYAVRTYYETDVSLERHSWAGVKALF